MRVLEKPLFDLIAQLYAQPLSQERWTPPGWKPKEKQGRQIGVVSDAAWRVVGLYRDLNSTLEKRFNESQDDPVLASEYQGLGALATEVMVVMIETQVRNDLLEAGLSPEDAGYFCIREDGVILDCVCQRLGMQFGDLLRDALVSEVGGKRTQVI